MGAILLAAAWLAVRSWPERWVLAWAIAMVGMGLNTWMANLWMLRSRQWEAAYWRNRQQLATQMIYPHRESRVQSQSWNGDGFLSANLDFQHGERLPSRRPLLFAAESVRSSPRLDNHDQGSIAGTQEAEHPYTLRNDSDSVGSRMPFLTGLDLNYHTEAGPTPKHGPGNMSETKVRYLTLPNEEKRF